ncbi:MAG: 4'-phosphopantetheinyl transferase [Pseudorhodobacter sp.]
MPDLAALAAAVCVLLPEGCGCAAADPRTPPDGLLPGEAITGTDKRLREYAAGRRAARQAMARIGLPPAAIPMGLDRAPVWPAGLSGSITHSATACLAAVAARPLLIGLDLEPDADLPADLWQTVLRPEEIARLRGDGRQAMVVFSAKEAAYKAQFPRSRSLFDFHTLEVMLSGGRFTAIFRDAVPGFAPATRLEGRITRAEGHILTLVAATYPMTA